jgi:hypothetical protein
LRRSERSCASASPSKAFSASTVKGKNRDTAWFAMTDRDWPALNARYEKWLDLSNFDTSGQQLTRLTSS